MHGTTHGLLIVSLGVWAFTIGGCTGRSTLDTVPVEGVVTLDGDPVAGATVTFVPVSAAQGMSATGRTDESGVYRLTAVGTEDAVGEPHAGTLPGEYYVGVRLTKLTEEFVSEEQAAESGGKATALAPGQSPSVDFVVPRKYRNPRNSGLTATVTEGENKIPLELTSS